MTKFACHRVRALLQRRFAHDPAAAISGNPKSRWAAGGGARDESGAVLILALVFLVTVSVIVGALTDWVTNDLMNTASFNSTQTLDSSATNAVTLGVQSIRYTPLLYNTSTLADETLNASPPSYCWGSGPSQAFNMNVYCSSVWNPTKAATRKVTVSACRISPALQPGTPAYIATWAAGQASCAAAPLLQAIVTFDDYPPTGVSGPSQVQCVTYCGSTLTVNSWNWTPAVPTVTNVTGLTGSFDGGQPIVITGTGFTSGMTVNFVDSNPLAQVNNQTTQQIVPATNVSFVSSTQINATSPGVTTLANYYITVTTPGGQTSAVMPNASCTSPLVDCFVYTTVAPQVTGLTPTSGYTTHSTAITITGSGFINGATVTMVQDSNGTPNTGNEQQATAVQVLSNNEITALTYPFTTVNQAFFVTVTTSGGASPYTTAAVFTFTQAPP
jgi:hypothetical protein